MQIFYWGEKDIVQYLQSFTNFSKLTSDEKIIFLIYYNNGDTEIFKHVSKFVNICIEKRKMAML